MIQTEGRACATNDEITLWQGGRPQRGVESVYLVCDATKTGGRRKDADRLQLGSDQCARPARSRCATLLIGRIGPVCPYTKRTRSPAAVTSSRPWASLSHADMQLLLYGVGAGRGRRRKVCAHPSASAPDSRKMREEKGGWPTPRCLSPIRVQASQDNQLQDKQTPRHTPPHPRQYLPANSQAGPSPLITPCAEQSPRGYSVEGGTAVCEE